MPRTTSYPSRAAFIADPNSIVRDTGRQIDWAHVATDGTYGATGSRVIPAGTVMGQLLSGASTISPRVVTTNPAVGILETDAVENDPSAAASGYGFILGGAVYQNLLASGVPDGTTKTELNAAGTGFAFLTYSDAR